MSNENNPVGRPTKYKPEYCKQVEKLCKLGATDKEIAAFFEVSEDTIYEWKVNISEFSESIKEGKIFADANIGQRLYERAMGFEHNSEEIIVIDKQIVRVPIRKIYPPDTTAAIFWLKNRRPKEWRDRTEHDLLSDGKPLQQFILEILPDVPQLPQSKGNLLNGANGNGKNN